MDREPLRYNFGEEWLEATPKNTVLYTFLGETAIGDMVFDNSALDHVFINLNEADAEGNGQATFIFKLFSDQFEKIAKYIRENDFPMVLNGRNLAECDIRAYLMQVDKNVAEFSDTISDNFDSN